jgi:hypothetical protein
MNDPIDSATSIARAAADAAGGPPTPTTGEDRVVTYFGAVDLLLATGLNVTTAQDIVNNAEPVKHSTGSNQNQQYRIGALADVLAKRGAEKNDEAAKLIGQRDAYDMLTRRVRGS